MENVLKSQAQPAQIITTEAGASAERGVYWVLIESFVGNNPSYPAMYIDNNIYFNALYELYGQ